VCGHTVCRSACCFQQRLRQFQEIDAMNLRTCAPLTALLLAGLGTSSLANAEEHAGPNTLGVSWRTDLPTDGADAEISWYRAFKLDP
jgi:hypothetical protein